MSNNNKDRRVSTISTSEKDTSDNFFADAALKKLFVQYNTSLPSSDAVKRPFSMSKYILKPKRAGFSDEYFEMLAFLKDI